MNAVQTALENNQSLKVAKKGAEKGKSSIICLKDSNGTKQNDKNRILEICTDYYKTLYSDNVNNISNVDNSSYSCSDDIPPITPTEVHLALRSMKYRRSPGEDGISTEALRIGEPVLIQHLTALYNDILRTGALPPNFCHSTIILLHKKGDKAEIGNYRPISLISHVYKTFIKIIEHRISSKLDEHQPPEQAGFRRGLSTTDHLQSINQIVEKHNEFNIPLYLAFIDFTKAFDSVKHSAIFDALRNQEVDNTYIQLLENIYRNSTAAIKTHARGPTFDIQKGVKQGDPLSPKLFTSLLEEIFRSVAADWTEKGIAVGERKLTNLRFADDIVLFSNTAQELSQMLEDLSRASLEVGLTMNMSKTKVMTNSVKRAITVGNGRIEYVHEYIYLGQLVSFQARQEKEVARRTENAWKSYWSMKELMKGKLPLSLKRKLVDVCILPILTYGAQTWSLTGRQRSGLGVCQRAMERSILGVRLTDRIRNTEIRSKTQVVDVTQKAATLKWNWAGHICRMPEELWAKSTTFWTPTNGKRLPGRPRRRWRDDMDKFMTDWQSVAQDRDQWKGSREAFALQWDTTGS